MSSRTPSDGADHPTSPSGIALRTAEEIDAIRNAARVVEAALGASFDACLPGHPTSEIDHAARAAIEQAGAESLFLGYRQGSSPPFPAVACVSVNDEVVHGVPGDRVLREGDLVSIDIGARVDGWCADLGTSRVLGDAPGALADLRTSTRALISESIASIVPGRAWSEIGASMEARADELGYGIVTEYVGHGVGRTLHERPKVPAYRSGFTGEDFVLQPGMVFALEPILTLERGRSRLRRRDSLPTWRMPVRVADDGWTVRTATGTPACHEEWMLAVTEEGCRVIGCPPWPDRAGSGAGCIPTRTVV